MPAAVERCKSDLLAKWKKDPSSKPKKRKKGQDDEGMAWAICQASVKMDTDTPHYDGFGPTLMFAAATSKPVLPQRGREIKVIEKEGKKYAEVPILRRGIFRSPYGTLVFNTPFIDNLVANYAASLPKEAAVTLDFRHSDKQGALAFLDKEDGGWLEKRDDGWLYAYGPVVDDEAEKIIASRRWRYCSPEIHLDYRSNLVQKLSADTKLDEITLEQYYDEELFKEVAMSYKTIQLGDVKLELEQVDKNIIVTEEQVGQLEGLVAKLERITTLEQAKTDNEATITQLEAKIAKLEKGESSEGDEIPEALRVRLEALERENDALKQEKLRERVAFALNTAEKYIDKDGRGHSKVFLDYVKAGMLLEPITNGDKTIKLENGDGQQPDKLVSYYRNLFQLMLENVPGQAPVEGRTEGNKDDHLQLGDVNWTEDELKSEIENFGKY